MQSSSFSISLVVGATLLLIGAAGCYGAVAGEQIAWLALFQGTLIAGFGAALAWMGFKGRRVVPRRVVLVVDFERSFIEAPPTDRAARAMLSGRATVSDVVDSIDRARADPRVRGLIGRVGAGGQGTAMIEEFRQAVERFRRAGKPALAFAETLGEMGPGNGGYYLACAFDEIWLQESGDVGLVGLRAETPFLAGSLDKLKITARVDRRKEYKSMAELFTRRDFSPAQREATESIVGSVFEQLVGVIAAARKLDTEKVRSLIDDGPFLAAEACDIGLVDGLGYRDEVHERLEKLSGGSFETISDADYLASAGGPRRKGAHVAVIRAAGSVQRGSGQFSPLAGGPAFGADPVCRAIREAVDDKRIRAIVLRIDSPGGSYVASDTIHRAIGRAREAGKPVIATLGNVAASGGYFIAMSCDRVIAQAGTLTGSIGVVGGKMLTREAWARLGLTWDAVESSANAGMYSGLEDYSPHGKERQQAWLDRVYDDFVTKAAADRGMDVEQMENHAKGRVWTGAQAKERGLVDELGGYHEAFAAVRAQLALPSGAPIRARILPAPKPAWLALVQREEPAVVALARSFASELAPVTAALRRAGLLGRRGVLEAPNPPELR